MNNVSFVVNKNDKICFTSRNPVAKTALFQILMGEMEPDEGSFRWGVTTSQGYLPSDNAEYFDTDHSNLVDWPAPIFN